MKPFTTYPNSPVSIPYLPPLPALPPHPNALPFPATSAYPSMPVMNSSPFLTNTPWLGQPPAQQRLEPVSDLLVDPITRKKYKMPNPTADTVLRLGPLDTLKLSLKNIFVTLPTTIYQGLRGDSRFTFSDFLNVATIPYFLGGAFLAASFRAGRNRLSFAQQVAGVSLYFSGIWATNKAINLFYKLKTGLDLDLRYKKSNGDIEKVFASTDFPRFDLLEENDYHQLARKMGIPNNLADVKREVNDRSQQIISAARADKLIVGALISAIGAGYFARSQAWGRLLRPTPLMQVWKWSDPNGGNLFVRLKRSVQVIQGLVQPALREGWSGPPSGENAWARNSVLGLLVATPILTLAHSWQAANGGGKKNYESPFIANLSPLLAPDQSPYTAARQQALPGGPVNNVSRKSVFDMVNHIESSVMQASSASPSAMTNQANENPAPGGIQA